MILGPWYHARPSAQRKAMCFADLLLAVQIPVNVHKDHFCSVGILLRGDFIMLLFDFQSLAAIAVVLGD